MTKCWNCNKELAANATSCPHCGVTTSKEAIRQMATIGPSGGNVKQIVIGATVADRYEIRRELGRGGMGIVYLAFDKTMAREVALKVIPQELCLDPRAVADLKRETGIALNLTHEHIVRLYNLDIWEGQAFVTMEYVSGGTLAHLLAEKERYTLPEILSLLRQMAQALDYSHNASPPVIHRDLKPLNVLMTEDGRIKIADFGLARVLRDSASRVSGHDSAGTLAYMAPEQVRGKGIGRQTDLYAFAAITYELLCGHPPFYTGDLRWQILHEEVEPIEGISEHINQVLARALDKEAKNRTASAGEFVELLTGEGTAAGKHQGKKSQPQKPAKTQPTNKPPTGPSRTPKLIVAVTTVFLLAAMAGGGWYFRGNVQNLFKSLFQTTPILALASTPSGAAVAIDGDKVGATPLEIKSLPDGAHSVTMALDRYEPYAEKVFIQQNKPVSLAATLTPEPFGDLEVKSDPAGASVIIDGAQKGLTPLSLTRLPKGSHAIALNHPDFSPWQGKVEIVPFTTASVSEKLVPAYGSLQVSSKPSGAKVQINKKDVGTTPYNDPKLRMGEYKVTVEETGFDGWSETVRIKPGETSTIQADLLSSSGSLSVTSVPEGAEVLVDGKKVGVTPLQSTQLKKGSHQIEVKKETYTTWTKKVTIAADAPQEIQAVLEKVKEVVATVSPIQPVAVPAKHPPTYTDPTTGMEFVFVPDGCYQMGDTFADGYADEKRVHEVCVDGFYMGKYEVTQGEYQKITGTNPSYFKKGDRYPVETVSWDDAQTFIKALNGKSGKSFRLPTEAEWEYAARSGGKSEKYSGSNSPDGVAWYDNNSGNATHQVGTKSPNALGLYDMSGNVWEWCNDWYGENYYGSSPRQNPAGPSSGALRVLRGGGWSFDPWDVRSARRYWNSPDDRLNILGFRLLLQASAPARRRENYFLVGYISCNSRCDNGA